MGRSGDKTLFARERGGEIDKDTHVFIYTQILVPYLNKFILETYSGMRL